MNIFNSSCNWYFLSSCQYSWIPYGKLIGYPILNTKIMSLGIMLRCTRSHNFTLKNKKSSTPWEGGPSHTPPPPLPRWGSVASLPRIITFSLQTHPLLEKPGDATDACSHFLGKGSIFWGRSLRRFHEKARQRGCFIKVIANGHQYKLSHYGIRGKALEWFRNYLNNRKQYVSLNDHNSTLKDIKCGVPQGSILGPLLFIVYINDFCRSSNILSFILFADDSNVFFSHDNPVTIVNTCTVNSELNKRTEWIRANKLSLNLQKTKYMLFSNTIDA